MLLRIFTLLRGLATLPAELRSDFGLILFACYTWASSLLPSSLLIAVSIEPGKATKATFFLFYEFTSFGYSLIVFTKVSNECAFHWKHNLHLQILTPFFISLPETIFSGNVGLAISQTLILTGMLQFGVRQTAEVISQMTSVERILQYTHIEREPQWDKGGM